MARVVGTCRLTAYSFVAIRLFVGLIIFTPGTQLSIYILLISAISEQWILFKCTCLATAAGIWNELLADLILNGEASGWWTILKDVQHCVRTWLLPYVCVWGLYYSTNSRRTVNNNDWNRRVLVLMLLLYALLMLMSSYVAI